MPFIQDQEGLVRVDFDVVLKCRDYDRISKWTWENIDYQLLPVFTCDEVSGSQINEIKRTHIDLRRFRVRMKVLCQVYVREKSYLEI